MRRIFIVIFMLVVGSAFSQDANRIIASVNNEVITARDLDAYSRLFIVLLPREDTTDFRRQVLDNIIQEKLITQAAKKDNFKIPDHWVEEKLKRRIANYDSYEDFEDFLVSQGINLTTLKERIREDLLIRQIIEKYVGSQVAINPREITRYYNAHIEDFESLPEYICWIAKSNKKIFLDKVAAEIKRDGFDKTRDVYNDIFFKIESDEKGLKQEMREVVTSINDNEFRITEIEGAHYLIYLKAIIPSHKKFLTEVKDEIYALLWKDKFEKKFQQWTAKLKSNAVIKVYD